MLLSGVTIDDRLVLQIAGRVAHHLGSKLVTACRLRRGMVALTVREQAILAALNDAPARSTASVMPWLPTLRGRVRLG